jgi:TetR/AcrR family transcriptional regulator, transcriptional repressor for nem operon
MASAGAAPRIDSRTRILDAAVLAIRSNGYAGTSVDDICTAAGVTKGSFFHHFSSKEDLAVAAAEHFGRHAEGIFGSAPYRDRSDPLERLLGYVDFRIAMLRGEIPEYTCLLGTMVQEAYRSHPAIREACERQLGEHMAMLANDIAEAKRAHAPRARWSAHGLALHVQAVIQGAFILAKASDGPAAAAESLQHLRRYLELLLHPSTSRETRR